MKNLGLFTGISVLVIGMCCPNVSWAASCKPHACPSNVKTGGNTEYLPTGRGSNQCYSCDSDDYTSNDEECNYGMFVGWLDANGRIEHVYQCVDQSGTVDTWVLADPSTICTDSPIKNPEAKNIVVRYSLKGPAGDYETYNVRSGSGATSGGNGCKWIECKTGFKPNATKTACESVAKATKQSCETTESRTTAAECRGSGWGFGAGVKKCARIYDANFNGGANCGYVTECEPGYEMDPASKKTCCGKTCYGSCRLQKGNGGGGGGGGVKPAPKPDPVQTKSCRERRAGWGAEEQACCDTGSEANLTPNAKGGKCICVDSNKEFKIQDGVGVCVPKGSTTPQPTAFTCPDTVFAAIVAKCAGNATVGASVTAMIAQIQAGCAAKTMTAESYNTLVASLNTLAAQCAGDAANAKKEQLRKQITEIYATLQAQVDGFGRSVWKNKDGGFNTSRLASDSIAAVVLGTAGGLITSNVIKKNQISGGFEDIQCTVGGQSVAGWGDEFRVGIR